MQSVPEAEPNLMANIPLSDQAAAAMPSQQQQQSRAALNQPIKLTEEQFAKLQSELDVVQGNMRVLSEMLNYLTTADNQMDHEPDSADIELLTVITVENPSSD